MNRKQTARMLRYRKLVAVLDDFPTETQAVPAFADAAAGLRERVALVGRLPKRLKSKGATESKATNRQALTAQLVKAANALYLLYRKENKLDAALSLPLTRSEFNRLEALEFVKEADTIVDAVNLRAADLAARYNLPADAVQALQTEATAYDESIGKPKNVIEGGKVLTSTTAQLLTELNRFRQDEFKRAVELLVDSHPLFYARLQEAMRVDDAGSRKRKDDGAGPDDGDDQPKQ